MTRVLFNYRVSVIMLLIIMVTSIGLYVRAQVPLVVDGYISMPDGSPASGASVTVSVSGGPSGSATSGGNGYYRVDLTVSPGTHTVTVRASKGSYSGSATGSGEAHISVNVRLSEAPPPTPPPTPPPAPKKSVKIELNVPGEAAVNTSVRISGKTVPRVSPVYLKVKDPKGGLKEYELTVKPSGNFSFDLTPTLLGLYKVSAYFKGDVDYQSASTPEYPLQVKAGSILDLTVTPTVVVAGAENIRINGSLYPPSTKNVSLYYSLDNVSWVFFAEASAATGVFSMVWEPRAFGDVFIKAEWAGNDTYTGSVAYGRFQTVLPSVCFLRSWVDKSPIVLGEEIRINGVLSGAAQPESAELTLHVYTGGEEVETFRLRPSSDGVFTISYTPGSPGIYVLLLEAGGVRLLKASNVTTVVVLGEVLLRPVNSTGGLLSEATVELKHSEVARSESGELTTILDLGDYEVIVKIGEAEVFRGSLSLRSNGVFLTTLSQGEEFPLPITSKPLLIELRTKTYSLSVHVVNEFGEPVGNIEVKVASSVFQSTGRTDADGRIVFSNIPAGTYAVSTSSDSKSVNLVRNESVILKGSGLNVKIMLIIEAIALVALCFTTVYFARKKPATNK
ncbi:MAG: carboxypeptidase-like regulatory domain-containing protein [Thermoproteota archaeon]